MRLKLEWVENEYRSGSALFATLDGSVAKITGPGKLMIAERDFGSPEAAKAAVEELIGPWLDNVRAALAEELPRGPNEKYPFSKLEIGESFVVKREHFQRSSLKSYVYKRNKDLDKIFTVLDMENGDFEIIREF